MLSERLRMNTNNDTSKIPNHVIKDLACFFMSDIIAFYESAEGKEEYEKWKETNK